MMSSAVTVAQSSPRQDQVGDGRSRYIEQDAGLKIGVSPTPTSQNMLPGCDGAQVDHLRSDLAMPEGSDRVDRSYFSGRHQ
jgi:hypothetical protein